MTARPRYGLAQRALHWIVAALVAGAFAGGQVIEEYGFEGLVAAFGQDLTNAIYAGHKSAGVLVLCLMALRLAVRLSGGKPAYDPPLPDWQRRAGDSAHAALYALLFAMPVLGWLATGAGGFPVQVFSLQLPPILAKDAELSKTLYELHGLVGSLIALIVVVHVGAAIWHGLVRKDGVFSRMV